VFRGLSLVGFYRFDGAEEVSQKQRILQMLEEAGERGVEGNEFYRACLPRFAARIKELRDQGYDISTRRIGGNHFVYTLRQSAKSGGPCKTQPVTECSQAQGAAVESSVTGRDMEPGFSPPEGAPGRAQQDHGQTGRFLHDSPVSHLSRGGSSLEELTDVHRNQFVHQGSAAAISGSNYYAVEAELEWEAA